VLKTSEIEGSLYIFSCRHEMISICKGIVASCLSIIEKWKEDLRTQYTCLQNKKSTEK